MGVFGRSAAPPPSGKLGGCLFDNDRFDRATAAGLSHPDRPAQGLKLDDGAAWAAFAAMTLLLAKVLFFLYFSLEHSDAAYGALSTWASAAAAGAEWSPLSWLIWQV